MKPVIRLTSVQPLYEVSIRLLVLDDQFTWLISSEDDLQRLINDLQNERLGPVTYTVRDIIQEDAA